jgi:hypothetical protein
MAGVVDGLRMKRGQVSLANSKLGAIISTVIALVDFCLIRFDFGVQQCWFFDFSRPFGI